MTSSKKLAKASAMLSLILRQSSKELKSTISLLQKRNFMFKVKTNEKAYRRKDNVEESFSAIYKAPMEYILTASNYITTISAVTFSAFVVRKLIFDEEVSSEMKEVGYLNGFAGMADTDMTYFALGLLVFVVQIRLILYKYPLRIYRNQTDQ